MSIQKRQQFPWSQLIFKKKQANFVSASKKLHDLTDVSRNMKNNVLYLGTLREEDTPKKLSNIGTLLKGYNILYGNPYQTDASVDPGFRYDIFIAKYNGKVTADGASILPEG